MKRLLMLLTCLVLFTGLVTADENLDVSKLNLAIISQAEPSGGLSLMNGKISTLTSFKVQIGDYKDDLTGYYNAMVLNNWSDYKKWSDIRQKDELDQNIYRTLKIQFTGSDGTNGAIIISGLWCEDALVWYRAGKTKESTFRLEGSMVWPHSNGKPHLPEKVVIMDNGLIMQNLTDGGWKTTYVIEFNNSILWK
jgi:hypothetical protein